MARPATPIILTEHERRQLEYWCRRPKTERRYAFRAKIIMLCAKGMSNNNIAAKLDTRPATASKWRVRFESERLAGLADAPRLGKMPKYGEETRQRILAKLDESPPAGRARWNGPLLAQALGNVSAHQVWRELRALGISLERRQSWCVSTDPEFAPKAADIIGLYLDPPENALVLCVDEKPCIQALERAQGWLRLPDGKALTGFNHEYARHGTTTLFGALDTATGQVQTGHYKRRRRREFLDFMNKLVAAHPQQQLHVVLDNLSTHKPKHDCWLQRHPNVHFHYTPTHASWLNQIEIWFGILTNAVLRGGSFQSVRRLREAIDAFTLAHNPQAAPFEWNKVSVHPKTFSSKYANVCK